MDMNHPFLWNVRSAESFNAIKPFLNILILVIMKCETHDVMQLSTKMFKPQT